MRTVERSQSSISDNSATSKTTACARGTKTKAAATQKATLPIPHQSENPDLVLILGVVVRGRRPGRRGGGRVAASSSLRCSRRGAALSAIHPSRPTRPGPFAKISSRGSFPSLLAKDCDGGSAGFAIFAVVGLQVGPPLRSIDEACHRRRIASQVSQAEVSERNISSPSARPANTSIRFTELRSSFTGTRTVRQGPPALPVLLVHRVRQARLLGHHRPRRRRERHPRDLEVVPRATGAALPPPHLLPPGELSGHRPPLRRDQRTGRYPRLSQAALPPPRPPLLARAGRGPGLSIRMLTARSERPWLSRPVIRYVSRTSRRVGSTTTAVPKTARQHTGRKIGQRSAPVGYTVSP